MFGPRWGLLRTLDLVLAIVLEAVDELPEIWTFAQFQWAERNRLDSVGR